MPNKDYALMMARYNQWQNDSLLTAAGAHPDDTNVPFMPNFYLDQ